MTISIPDFHSPDVQFEQLALQCPKQLGRGGTREVFEIPGHLDKVLKVMHVPGNHSNWAEMVVYQAAGHHRPLFAQIHSISFSGKFMVMERLFKVTWEEEVSPVLHTFPRFINDRKPSNFGKDSAGNIKMLDYAFLDLGALPKILHPTLRASDGDAMAA